MERKRNFDIHFVALKNSIHVYDYELNNGFFAMYEESLVKQGDLKVKMFFDKKDSFFMLKFQVDGFINLACDRCTDFFDYELLCDFDIIVKFDEVEDGVNDDDVIYISRGDTSFNVADLIYEYILINIPIQVIHPTDRSGQSTCNPEMLDKINLNQKIDDDEIDPRWADLSKLKS